MAVSLSTLSRLGVQLQKASHTAGTGNKWLSALAVSAFTVSTWMAMTVAGGTWMFYERYRHPSAASLRAMSDGLRQTYVGLAALACVFVVPAMMSLVAQSAVLGASGRERRLAMLRLLGLSNRDITRLTLVETSALAFLGLVLGTVLYVVTAPAWSLVSFQNTHIGLWEILLPWWGYPALWTIILVLAAVAAVVGLKRVMVSPLGGIEAGRSYGFTVLASDSFCRDLRDCPRRFVPHQGRCRKLNSDTNYRRRHLVCDRVRHQPCGPLADPDRCPHIKLSSGSA